LRHVSLALQRGARRDSRRSRHLRGLQYLPAQDALFSFGGSPCNVGNFSPEVWFYSFGTATWTLNQPYNPLPFSYFATAYNPQNGHVLIVGEGGTYLSDYDPGANTFTKLNPSNGSLTSSYSRDNVVVDPTNNLFVDADSSSVGYPNISAIDIRVIQLDGSDGFAVHDAWATGCTGAGYTGMAWDSALGLVVMYPGGGNQLMFLNTNPAPVATAYGTVQPRTCMPVTIGSTKGTDYPNDPDVSGSSGVTNGLWGRFSYFPHADAFILAHSVSGNVWMLRL
jgi:hypothetical protein